MSELKDFSDGVFSTWIFRCQRCGEETRSQKPLQKPPICRCGNREYDAPFLFKFDKPPLDDHPELLYNLGVPVLQMVLQE